MTFRQGLLLRGEGSPSETSLSSPISSSIFRNADPPPTATVIAKANPVTPSSLLKARTNAFMPFARTFAEVMNVITGGLRLRNAASAYVLTDICNGWSFGYLCR